MQFNMKYNCEWVGGSDGAVWFIYISPCLKEIWK